MITIAIQAGGRSIRMGQDKGLVKLGELALIEHVLKRLSGLGDEVIITTNQPDKYAHLGVPLYADAIPGAGAASGLQTALEAAQGEKVLVAACDMPFVQPRLAQTLLEQLSSGIDVVVPYRDGRYEPMLAVYRRDTCLPALSLALDQGQRRLIGFYPQVQVLTITDSDLNQLDPEGISFFNVNTPDDLAIAKKMLQALI
jgi:molybdopterin-guanine dinucleotide biosynthesis protein A